MGHVGSNKGVRVLGTFHTSSFLHLPPKIWPAQAGKKKKNKAGDKLPPIPAISAAVLTSLWRWHKWNSLLGNLTQSTWAVSVSYPAVKGKRDSALMITLAWEREQCNINISQVTVMLFFVHEWRQENSVGSKEQGREATGDLEPLITVTPYIAAGTMLWVLLEGDPEELCEGDVAVLCLHPEALYLAGGGKHQLSSMRSGKKPTCRRNSSAGFCFLFLDGNHPTS